MGTFRDWCKVTTCHGWGHLITAETKCCKIVWSIIMLLCFIAFWQQMAATFQSYASIHTHYSTSVNQIFHKKGLTPPTITICNHNKISKSKAEEYGFDKDLRKYFLSRTGVGRYLASDMDVAHLKNNYSTWRHKHDLTYEKIVQTMGHSCESTIQMIDSEIVATADDLCKSTMETNNIEINPIITQDFGLCHQINISEELKIEGTGSWFSIKLLLNAETYEYLEESINNYNDEGLVLQVSFEGKVSPGDWLTIMPGRHTWIGMKTVRSQLAKSASDALSFYAFKPCALEPIMPVAFDRDYSVSRCNADCLYAKAANVCNCRPIIAGKKLKVCEVEEFDDCFLPYFNNDTESKFEDVEQCKEEFCHQTPCNETIIESRVLTSKFPTKNQESSLIQVLKENGLNASLTETVDLFENNLALVDIYYSTLATEVLEKYERHSLEALISSIGGQMGLWMGVSMITIYHLIITCCCSCCACCKHKKVIPRKKTESMKSPEYVLPPINPQES